MFIVAFARTPSDVELKRWSSAVREWGPADLMKDEAAWSQLGHAFFNAKEFLYYR